MRTHLLTGLLGLCLSIGILYSCKKDEPTPLPEERQLVEEARLALKTQAERDFFDFDYLEDNHALILPEGKLVYRDAQDQAFVQQVMDKILLQNAAEGFVPELILRIGYPAWSRSEVILENSNMHRVAFIPFIKLGENKISAYLMAFKPGEAWWFRLIEKEHLKQALIQNEPSIAENSKKFYAVYDLSFDMALFDTVDSLIQEWVWDHIDTDELTGQDNIDFRCTTYPVETGICIRPGQALHDDTIEERNYDCPGNLVYAIINEYIVYGADCWNSNGYQYFPGGEDWYGNPGGLGTVPITYNNHPYLLPIITLCNEIDQVQSGEVVNGQTYAQADVDRCNQIQQVIYYTMISPNDLAWLLSNNTEAFTDIATYVSNGDRTPLQLQGVSAYIRLLVQGRVNIPLREFMPKYQIVFGELVPVLGLTEEEAEYLMDNEELTDAITQFLEEYNDIEGKQAAAIILQIHRQGLLTGPYAELQRDYIIESFWHLTPDQYAEFVIQCIILKQQWQNANQGENCDNYCTYKIALKAYWNTLKGYVHTALDICGLIPVAGEPCDLINGTLYLVQGDGVNASLSFAGALPVVGWAATGAKYALILVATADGVKTFKVVWDNIVSLFKFPLPSETSFRKIVGVTDPDFQAHHVIPQGLYGHPAIQKAAQAANTPWHMHHPKNGIGVHVNRHNGSHNNYNTQVEMFLNSIDINLPPDEISQIIINKQNEWRIFIDASSDHINQIILP